MDKSVAQIFVTENYKQFTPLYFNRAKKEGFDKKRVKGIINKMTAGIWVNHFGLVYVNKDFTIVDGNNTFAARSKQGEPIYYVILTDDLVNPKCKTKRERDAELAKQVSKLNDVDQSWSGQEHFDVARHFGLPLAKMIDKVIRTLSFETGLKDSNFLFKHIYGIIFNDSGYMSGKGKITVSDYDNSQAVIDAQSTQCKTALSFYGNLIKAIDNLNLGTVKNKVLRTVFKAYFNPNKGLDADRLINTLNNSKNIPQFSGKLNEIADLLNDVYNHRYMKGRKPQPTNVF